MQVCIDAWRRQLSFLTDAFLTWKHRGPPLEEANAGAAWSILTMSFTRKHVLRTSSQLMKVVPVERKVVMFSHAANAQSINETLVYHGFIGASPEKPTIAFSFSLLNIYRQLHRVCPRLSIDALSKSLSHLHHVFLSL
jgi:CxC1 like cysteine cluster associated with KDZ transposases